MPYLVIDTSSDQCLLALMDEEHILASSIFFHGNELSQTLAPSIQALLFDATLTPGQLSRIAVGIGPGSYTGTRVGVAVAKSLAFGLQVPLQSFCSLFAFLPDKAGVFAALLPAKSGNYFLLKGTLSSAVVTQQSAALVAPQELLDALHDVDVIVAAEQPHDCPAKTLFSLVPNLSPLHIFLNCSSSVYTPDVELFYLHVP